jgi:response regulator RpfG family c-di-GMP phosphodiesterase
MERILFVDDEPNILAGYKRQLRSFFDVEIASSGKEGLELMQYQEQFAVVVADFRMPGIDGVQFLTKARNIAPDTVRMMLTGHAELGQAIDAVNEGNIFRFLTKPCLPESLLKALNDGINQYRLITAEKELLEKTLSNSIRLLTEMLSLTNQAAFSQTLRLRKIVSAISHGLNLIDSWQFMLAAMLSQIGCVALPSELIEKINSDQPLSKSEEIMFASHPLIGYKLLKDIPRIEAVPEMVRDQQKLTSDFGNEAQTSTPKAKLGAQILKVALEYDRMNIKGLSHMEIISSLIGQPFRFNSEIVQALGSENILSVEWQAQMVFVKNVVVGMIAQEEILAKDGMLLLSRSQEISLPIYERLHLAAKEIGVVEPFRVLVPPSLE